ncbi:MAG: hypothetical protein HON04_12575 [Planctomicrobium sp.]|jgi:hypothetical protein|nr:hypothetical protein [Planctomicrobium sp.]
MVTIDAILQKSQVLSIPTPSWLGDNPSIQVSRANQLLGTWDALTKYRKKNYHNYGKQSGMESWQAHHIFEDRELDYLGVREKFPPKSECLCVLIPQPAHVRINSIFIQHTRRHRNVSGILEGYRFAHSVLGDYTGAKSDSVAQELDQIIRAAFHCAGLIK